MRVHKINNVNKALDFIASKGVKLVSIGAEGELGWGQVGSWPVGSEAGALCSEQTWVGDRALGVCKAPVIYPAVTTVPALSVGSLSPRLPPPPSPAEQSIRDSGIWRPRACRAGPFCRGGVALTWTLDTLTHLPCAGPERHQQTCDLASVCASGAPLSFGPAWYLWIGGNAEKRRTFEAQCRGSGLGCKSRGH